MKYKMLLGLLTVDVLSTSVVSRGQETLGVTLDKWWQLGDLSLSVTIMYLCALPLVVAYERYLSKKVGK